MLKLRPGCTPVVLGKGLSYQRKESGPHAQVLVACNTGGMLQSDVTPVQANYWIDAPYARRYIPSLGDTVVGVVTQVMGAQLYQVEIGAPDVATLDQLEFDGATKHNKPRLTPGDSVFCHVKLAERDLDVELSCMAVGSVAAKDWVTGESVFGPLERGLVFPVPLAYARDLFTNAHPVLALLGEKLSFEVAIGLNGRVWIRSATGPKTVVALRSVILDAQLDQTVEQISQRIERHFPSTASSALGEAAVVVSA